MCFIISQGMREARNFRDLPPFMQTAILKEKKEREASEATGEASEAPKDQYVAHGFEHPQMEILMKDGTLKRMFWGLIPAHTKSRQAAKDLWDMTTLARGESMFELPSFKEAAATFRRVIPLTGYFEHQDRKGKKVPHYIHAKDGRLLFVAVICSKWTAPETGKTVYTFAIVTSPPNALAEKIHNKPRGGESRMPLILEPKDLKTWFSGTQQEVQALVKANTSIDLTAYTVAPLSGKDALGNCPEAIKQFWFTSFDRVY